MTKSAVIVIQKTKSSHKSLVKSRQKSPKNFCKTSKKLTSPKKALNLKKALKTSKLPKNLSQPSPRTLFDKGVKKGAWRKINFTLKKGLNKK